MISLYTNSDFSGYTFGQQIPRPFILIPDKVPIQTSISPIYLHHVPPMTPFILFPEEYGPIHRDVQIVTRSGRVGRHPLTGYLPAQQLERMFRERMMRFYDNCALHRLVYPSGAYWPHPLLIEMH